MKAHSGLGTLAMLLEIINLFLNLTFSVALEWELSLFSGDSSIRKDVKLVNVLSDLSDSKIKR